MGRIVFPGEVETPKEQKGGLLDKIVKIII